MYRAFRNLALVALVAGGIPLLMRSYRLHFNWTASAPIGFYRKDEAPLSRGRYALVAWPESAARLALIRHYGLRSHAHTLMPVLKQVAAMPGDSVMLSADGVRVNGTLRPDSRALATDSKGRILNHWPFGLYLVTSGQVWIVSSSSRSFDSRYFGPIPVSQIKSTVHPVLTR